MKLSSQRVLIFKSKTCGHCIAMDKAKTVEKFVDKNFPPKMAVVRLDCADEEGEAPTGSVYEKNFKLSDSYGVEGFPTIIIEGRRPDGSAIEIARADAGTVSAYTVKELDRVYKEGMELVEDLADDVLSQDEAAKQIPW